MTIVFPKSWIGRFACHAGATLLCLLLMPVTQPLAQAPATPGVNLVWQHQSNGHVRIWELDQATRQSDTTITQTPDPNWKVAASADLNGDGHADLISQRQSDGLLIVSFLDGTAITQTVAITPFEPTTWKLVAAGDMDGDGTGDLIWQDLAQGWVAVTLLDGTAVTSTALVSTTPLSDLAWRVIGTGRVDSDQHVDLIWYSQTTGDAATWLMNGTTAIFGQTFQPVRPTESGWRLGAVGDLNVDNKPDVIWQHQDGRLAYWLMDGVVATGGGSLSPAAESDTEWQIVEAFGRLGSVAAPTFGTPGGLYSADQSVPLMTSTPGATIRFTTDGSDPTMASSAYSGPIAITGPATIKARAYKAGLAASSIASATYAFQAATPQFTPSPGAYPAGQTIEISSGTPGATIHYTVDGSDPTPASATYSGPLQLPEWVSTTLKARAFRANWTPSLPAVGAFQIGSQDATPPTISVRASPAPNSAGWNNTDVTVEFDCTDTESGIQHCPTPLTVSTEGAGQIVSGTAVDQGGHMSTASITLNMDKTAGTATISGLTDGHVTSNASLAFSASVADEMSGVASASCNGQNTPVVEGGVSCNVVLTPGRNSIVVAMLDRAGNSNSTGLSVHLVSTPSRLDITPNIPTLVVGESRTLQAQDEFGQSPSSVSWTAEPPGVVDLAADGSGEIIAVAVGQTTISAAYGNLSASVGVTVVAGPTLPGGVSRWVVSPLPGALSSELVYSHRPADDDPDMFFVESSAAPGVVSEDARIRGLRSDGTQLWTSTLPLQPGTGSVEYLMGDSAGGVIAVLSNVPGSAIVRAATPAGSVPWRYDAPFISAVAQAGDGTVYAMAASENWGTTGSVSHAELVALDGLTGAVRFKVSLPSSTGTDEALDGQLTTSVGPDLPTRIVVDSHDNANIAVRIVETFQSQLRPGWSKGRLEVHRITPQGGRSATVLDSWDINPAFSVPGVGIGVESIVAHASGGAMVTWRLNDNFPAPGVLRGASVTLSGTSSFTRTEPWQPDLVGDDGVAYLGGSSVRAVSMSTGTTLWEVPIVGTPIMALAEGQLAVHSGTGTLTILDNSGGVIDSSPMAMNDPLSTLQFGTWHGFSQGSLAAIVGAGVHESTFSFQARGRGNAQKQDSARQLFKTVDGAAKEVLRAFNPFSVEFNREFGGPICQHSNGRFYSGRPAIGDPGTVDPSTCPTSVPLAGEYHTHARHGNDGFSASDISRADSNGKPSYVATPCGNIWKYVGPNGTQQKIGKTDTPIKCVQ